MKNNPDVTVPFSLDVHQGLTWEQTIFLIKGNEVREAAMEGMG